MHVKRHEEKFQKKNRQLVDVVDITQNEERKETSFEDAKMQLFMNSNLSDASNRQSIGSPFKLEQRKRVKTSNSQEEMILIHDQKEFPDLKVNQTHIFS
jgi:hypothetical protein